MKLDEMRQIQGQRNTEEISRDRAEIAVAFFTGDLKPFQIVKGLSLTGKSPDGKVTYLMARDLRKAIASGMVTLTLTKPESARGRRVHVQG